MGDTATPLTIGSTAFGAATSAAGAIGQNRAVKRSIGSLDRSFRAERDQTDASAALEQQKLARRTAQVLGRLRVAEAESGGVGGSFAALENGAAISAAIDSNVLETNRVNTQKAIASQYVANATRILANKASVPLTATFGAAKGFETGLQIQTSLDQIDATAAAKKAQEDAALAYITGLPPVP